jgi:hypothetical protein
MTSGSRPSASRTAASPSLAVPTRSTPGAREQQLQALGGQWLVVGDQNSKWRLIHLIDPAA